MRRWLCKFACAASLLVAAAFAQITYNAPTGTAFIPYGTIPNVGGFNGANTLVVPPEFPNVKIIRITDLATGGQSAVHGGYTTSCDASSEENRWNINKDRFMICQIGNWQMLWAWNALTLTATRDTSFTSPGLGSTAWSYTQPYVYYHTHLSGGNDPTIFSYDATCGGGISTCTPPVSTVVDIATACSISALQSNSSASGGTGPSGDDQTFGGGFSSGGAANELYAVVWNRTTGCTYWNTGTRQVFNAGVLQGLVSVSDEFQIHNSKLGKGGTWLKVAESTCISSCTSGVQNIFWSPGTLTTNLANSANSCGHTAAGYNSYVNKCSGVTSTNGLFKSLMTTPNTNVSLPIAYPSGTGDQAHISWADDNAADTMPFFASMEDTTFAGSSGWDNTILAVATDGSGLVWQLLHHYVSQINAQAFIPIAVSQDGTLLLFTSDWNQTLGCSDGVTLGCGLNNSDWATGAYTTTSIITPLVGNAGVSGIGYSFHPQSNCTASGTEPASWNQTIGGTSADSGCTWVNAGLARTDVFLAVLPAITNVPCISACSFLYADGEPSDNGMLDGFVR